MSFRENLLKKIEIDQLARQVTASMGPPDSSRRIDQDLARRLLGIAGYEMRLERDLELYLIPRDPPPPQVLVLDNDFPIYTTTPEDVAMRKSPLVKEMVKIRNIIKILNDSDVISSKKEQSVEKVRADCIAALDLTYTVADIEEIEKEGLASLEQHYNDGVIEALELFAELLDYKSAPRTLKIPHQVLFGKLQTNNGSYGPMVLFDRIHGTLKLIEKPILLANKSQVQFVRAVADGGQAAAAEGAPVFSFLKTAVLAGNYTPATL